LTTCTLRTEIRGPDGKVTAVEVTAVEVTAVEGDAPKGRVIVIGQCRESEGVAGFARR